MVLFMAGGKFAEIVPCIKCAGKAVREYEGLETDWYRCEKCGSKFGVDWTESAIPPTEPQWPIDEAKAEEIRATWKLLNPDT